MLFESGSRLQLVDREVFSGCAGLRGIELPDGVEEICLDAFIGSGLESFVAPKSLRVIRQSAFRNCKCLKQVALGEGLEALEDYYEDGYYYGVFGDCGLEEVTLPGTLERMGEHTFE